MFLKRKTIIFCFWFGTWTFAAAKKKKSLNMDHVDMGDWKLPRDQEYQQIVELSVTNFHHKITETQDAWIVVIYQEKIPRKWTRHAERMKGTLWYGSLDYVTERELADDLMKNEEIDWEGGVALLFPFGLDQKDSRALKKNNWPKQVSEPEEAEKLLKSTFPDHTKEFTFRGEDITNFQNWIVEAYYKSQPPRFPVLCITDEPMPQRPISLLSISNYFYEFFAFGVVHKDNLDKLYSIIKEIPIPKVYPQYLLLLGKEPSSKQMEEGKYGLTFDVVPFQPRKYGEPDRFLAVLKFLFTINEDYRESLLGRRKDEDASLQSMESLRNALTARLRKVNKRDHSKFTIKTEL